FYTAKGIEGASLYSQGLRRRAEAGLALEDERVGNLMRPRPPVLAPTARFADIAKLFLNTRVNNLYVVDDAGKFLGVVSLHDIKPYLGEPELAAHVLARDILHEDFPRVRPAQPLTEALAGFLTVVAERLPVVDDEGMLLGSLAKGDVLLSLVEKRRRATEAAPPPSAITPAGG
ncbi:MAG: hypothetical protein RLZZ15_1518, partial [Verrucomicrobiota bacterium]